MLLLLLTAMAFDETVITIVSAYPMYASTHALATLLAHKSCWSRPITGGRGKDW